MKASKYKDLISLKAAAREFGLSPVSLRIYAHRKKLEGMKIGRNWVTTREAVKDYLENRKPKGRKKKSKY